MDNNIMTSVSAKTQQMNTAYAPSTPPQFNAGTNVRSFIAPAIQATLIASAPVLEKIPLEITRAALETAYKLPSFKPAPFNIINLIKSPAAWGNVLKGLAGAAAGYVSGSGAEIEFAKLQGQIPGYVDGRSAQLGSAALDVITKNAGPLFSKLTPDQRGRLLMGAAPLMQALMDGKIKLLEFKQGMSALLGQVQTGKKAEIKLPQKKDEHKNHGLGDHGQQTKLLPGKKTTTPDGGGRAAPVVKGVELEPLVKKDGTQPAKKHKTDGKQPVRASANDGAQPSAEAGKPAAQKAGAAKRKTVEEVKAQFKEKIDYTARARMISKEEAYRWLAKNDPEVAVAHLGLSANDIKTLKTMCKDKPQHYKEVTIDYFKKVASGSLEAKYAVETVDKMVSDKTELYTAYHEVKAADPEVAARRMKLTPKNAEALKDLCRGMSLGQRQKIIAFVGQVGNRINLTYLGQACHDSSFRNHDADLKDLYVRNQKADVLKLAKSLKLTGEAMKAAQEFSNQDATHIDVEDRERAVVLLKKFKSSIDVNDFFLAAYDRATDPITSYEWAVQNSPENIANRFSQHPTEYANIYNSASNGLLDERRELVRNLEASGLKTNISVEVAKLSKRLKLDSRDTETLNNLFKELNFSAKPDLAERVKKFLLDKQSKNILPTTGNHHVVTQQLTGDALSELELYSMGGHDLAALDKYLRSQGY
jgi:hypothetical protein